MGTGLNVSKEITYAVLAPPLGVSVAKETTYAVTATGLRVSKELTYAVLRTLPSAVPLPMKRIPLTVDFASCTYDQASRLLMYELYRSLGLDPSDPFVQEVYPELAGTAWKPPYTIVLRAWGEAVDAVWNILKGEPGEPICGRIITIDESVMPEWVGDYEIMEVRMFPFQGDASLMSAGRGVTGRASATAVQPASADSGTLELTLRTYNPDVFFDVSADPTYATVPGADLATGSW